MNKDSYTFQLIHSNGSIWQASFVDPLFPLTTVSDCMKLTVWISVTESTNKDVFDKMDGIITLNNIQSEHIKQINALVSVSSYVSGE